MREWFAENWEILVQNRSKMAHVSKEEPLEALSNIWFLAGIFHDIGTCIEKSMHVYDCHRRILKIFEASILPPSETKELSFAKLSEKGQKLLYEIGDPLKNKIEPIIEESIKKGKPDHGFFGALHLFNTISEGKQQCYAREAARSIALHNVIGSVNPQEKNLLSWEEEPIGCLLILCDQIQTWERERDDRRLSDRNEPERAELLSLVIKPGKERPDIKIDIDYIAPRHVIRNADEFLKTKDDLQFILRNKPSRALNKIKQLWPFSLTVYPSLSRNRLDPMKFD